VADTLTPAAPKPDLPSIPRSLSGHARQIAIRSRRAYRKDEYREQFAQMALYVKKLRYRCRMPQRQFAELLGVSVSTISRWECEYSLPDLPQRKRMQDVVRALDRKQSPEDIRRAEREMKEDRDGIREQVEPQDVTDG
jgi:DNA-binding transcriptional regulator YiaG